jgi:hypothetical protein
LIWKTRQEILQEGRKTTYLTPAIMIRGEISKQTGINIAHPERFDKQRSAFFRPIRDAWDVIAFEHYRWEGTGEQSYETHLAGCDLSSRYERAVARGEPRPETITLDPLQVKILDALAEAADVPHQRGQTEIEIPAHLREYKQRLQAKGEWRFE